MALYLDSADLDQARLARERGGVRGVTTNPSLLAEVEGRVDARLAALAQLGFERVYYQLRSDAGDALRDELAAARRALGDQLVLKIPATARGFEMCARLSPQHPCCVTALFSAAQALRARACGADQVAVYVNRATRQLGDGPALVRQIASVLEGSSTRVLAASLKTPEEAVEAILAGAHDLTLASDVLEALSEHPASLAALARFDTEGRGIEPR